MNSVNAACLSLLLLASFASAQEDNFRPPTEAEKQAVAKYVEVMNRIFDQFQSDDWDEHVDYTIDDDAAVRKNKDVPFEINQMLQRSYEIRHGSERYNRIVQPAMDKMTQAQQKGDIPAMKKAGDSIQPFLHLQVHAVFNTRVAVIDPAPSQNKDLKLPGVALAYKLARSGAVPHGTAYLLEFGVWGSPSAEGYTFKFKHPHDTPYIENIEIAIDGADDRIQELLHKIDWRQVNDALTK